MYKRVLYPLIPIYISTTLVMLLFSACSDNESIDNGQNNNMPHEIIGKDGAPMVLIPAGEFQMGSNDDYDGDGPVHTVYIDAFYMDVYEVTNAQYNKFVQATGHKEPEGYIYVNGSLVFGKPWQDKDYNGDNQPVICVIWEDAVAYSRWAGKRLPTEAEWEKAARGGLVGKRFPWGDNITHDDANYYGTGGKDKWEYSSPVGSFAPNGYGLYDVAGNVCEWCADWYDAGYYYNSPKSNPTGPRGGIYKVYRGGSWSYYTLFDSGWSLHIAHRTYYDGYFPTLDLGTSNLLASVVQWTFPSEVV